MRADRIELGYSGSEELFDDTDGSMVNEDDDLLENVLAALNPTRHIAIINEIEGSAPKAEPAIVFCCLISQAEEAQTGARCLMCGITLGHFGDLGAPYLRFKPYRVKK